MPVTFSCEDRGGSTLQTCDGPAGRRLDTTIAGQHTWRVAARDGAGRHTTVTRSYVVTESPTSPTAPLPPLSVGGPRPDLAARTARSSWLGAGTYAPTPQTVALDLPSRDTVRLLRIRLMNTGTTRGRFRLRASTVLGRGAVTLTYRSGGKDRTRAISRGWRTRALSPGQSLRVGVRVRVTRSQTSTLPLRASGHGSSDRVVVKLRR